MIALNGVKPYVPTPQTDLKKTGRGPNCGDKKGTKGSVAEGADMSIAIAAIIASGLSSEVQSQVRTVLHSCIGNHTAYRCVACRLSKR